METITKTLENTSLSDESEELEQLPFRPQADSGIPETVLDKNNIPRYLFRVVSPISDGHTDERWVHSMSAHGNRSSSTEDIFFNLDSEKRAKIARTLNAHLQWLPKDSMEDNFVSWTSSLLFAIQYIYFRHVSPKDESCLAEIKLYIIDTTKFPRGTFLRDLDLIDAFWKLNYKLKKVRSMRNGPSYYFGEYLSQGPLKIENKCDMISADILFEQDRLRRLQPEFAELVHFHHDTKLRKGMPPWSKEVNRLRDTLWSGTNLPMLPSVMGNRLEAVGEIIQNVASGWRYPLAIYFAALIGSESSIEKQGTEGSNEVLAHYFRSSSLDIDLQKREEFRPSNFNVVAPDTMPELKQVQKLVREIYTHAQLERVLGHVRNAKRRIRNLHNQNTVSENGHYAFVAGDPSETLARAGQNILSELDTLHMLCKEAGLAV